jgi:hypothetical protein
LVAAVEAGSKLYLDDGGRGRPTSTPCPKTIIQEIAMTLTLTPRKCLGYRSPVEVYLSELGKSLEIRFA